MLRILAAALCLGLTFLGQAGATEYFVDGANTTSCTDTPSGGSDATPFCTITYAVGSGRAAAGNIVTVKPHTYREEVIIPGSGASGNPFIVRSYQTPLNAATTIVDGSDDISSGPWTQEAGNVWRTTIASGWTVDQVFKTGVRLNSTTVTPSQMLANTYQQSGTTLYVNVGGNPSVHLIQAGRRATGFTLSNKSYVTIDGFTVARTNDRGIKVSSTCTGVTIQNNYIRQTDLYGVQLQSCTSSTVHSNSVFNNKNHGILLTDTNTSTVSNNAAYSNGYGTNSGVGIRIDSGDSNTIKNNVAYDNQDSGFAALGSTGGVGNSADGNTFIQNRSYRNGQHGFDQNYAPNTTHVNDVAWGNAGVGFNFEGASTPVPPCPCGSTGGKVYNSVSSNHQYSYNLQVDSNSTSQFASNYNLYWNVGSPNPARIRYGGQTYDYLSDPGGGAAYFQSTGNEMNGLKADPKFADPLNANFSPQVASPLVDSADSGVTGWSLQDALGNGRYDVPSVANTGAGSTPYADRGAIEARQ